MNIKIKNSSEIIKMRTVCKLASQVLEMIKKFIKPGVTTDYLNDICHDYICNKQNAIPAPLNYHGFPKSICTSINNVVCHGIPNKYDILNDGDIINIDITVKKNGYHGDTSAMFYVGNVIDKTKKLCKVTQECLYKAIKIVKPNIQLREIGKIIQNHAEHHGYSIVKNFCGHGIGKEFHEDPYVLHYDSPENNILLKEGMIFTIEPMLNIGSEDTKILKDRWTVITKDNSLSAQWEHTILVTRSGYEILTLRKNENIYL